MRDNQPAPRLLTRAALALYPPSWRARYGEEIAVMIDDSGGRLGAAISLAWRALPAWLWPPRHLHDRDARMRSSLSTVLVAGAMLTGVGLLFAQLTQFQGLRPAGHPLIDWAYLIFDAAVAVGGLAAAVGALPLWLVMLRRARREHRSKDTAYLLLPVVAPAVYLAGLAATTHVAAGPHGVSPWIFLVATLLGFVAAAVSCAGPILAMRRLRPRGPAVQFAVRAAGVATSALVLAGLASSVAVAGLCWWVRDFAGYRQGPVLAGYLVVVGTLGVIAAVGAARGARAALPGPRN